VRKANSKILTLNGSMEFFGILMGSSMSGIGIGGAAAPPYQVSDRICGVYRALGSGLVSWRGKGTPVENGTGESLVAAAEPAGPTNRCEGRSSKCEVVSSKFDCPSICQWQGWERDTAQGSGGFIAL